MTTTAHDSQTIAANVAESLTAAGFTVGRLWSNVKILGTDVAVSCFGDGSANAWRLYGDHALQLPRTMSATQLEADVRELVAL